MKKDTTENIVEIFTDGACRGNPGKGGWGALLRSGKHEKKIYGGESQTTNNRMELTATIKALEALKKPSKIILTTDSKYVIDGITEWIFGWQKNNWRNSAKQEVKNKDLWQALLALTKQHDIAWKWIKGHAGHKENELADELANKGIENI